jgi:parallel beta-helix repeat protein
VTYTKHGPFTDYSGTPGVSAALLNDIETALIGAAAEPSPAPSGGDDTAVLQGWLNSVAGKAGRFTGGAYTTSATLTIPASTAITGLGASITGASGTFDMVSLGSGATLNGLEINGNSSTRTGGNGVVISAGTGNVVRGCYIHNINGKGVTVVSGSAQYLVGFNRIVSCGGQGISLDSSSTGRIIGNRIDTCQHGIQWWGGDSSVSTTIGITSIVILGNTIKSVTGGIWGSLGQYVTVTGNNIDTCSDVGIDFEGCLDSVATGNVVRNASNSGLAVFHASSRVLFTGNTVDNSMVATNGHGFHAYTTQTNTRITVTNNTLTTAQLAITNDTSGSLTDSVFSDNEIRVTNAGYGGISLYEGSRLHVLNNTVHSAGFHGIDFQGVSDGRIEGNQVFTDSDTSTAGQATGGIHLYWRSATYPGKRNRIRNNVVVGFVQAIFDNCWGDNASYALIENNVATPVNHKGTTGYTGVINNNRKDTDHTASVVAAV